MKTKSVLEKTDTVTRCIRCGRKLKTEEAKQRGYGSYCWYLQQKEKKHKAPLFSHFK